MAGRGRGGGGRGRGRGAMSFNVEQLGFSAGEALPGPVLQPPPLYPPLERRPVPLKSGTEVEYLLALKRDFVEFLKYSPAYVLPAAKVKDIERYSDYKNVETPNKSGALVYDWKRFPLELRPQISVKKKKRLPQVKENSAAKKVRKLEDVSNKLDELEKLEEQGDVEDKSEENKDEKEESEQQEGELEEEEDQDEEMDDGTDYVNNYFDNGESYLDDEDDNLDDGPVY